MNRLLKKFIISFTTLTLVLTSLFSTGITAKAEETKTFPWSKVAGGTTGDYIADSFDGVEAGHVFESVTQERLLDILSSQGDYYIIFGSPKLETTRTVLTQINELAKKEGINKIYIFDPYIDGYQLDITKSDTVFKTANGTSIYELWKRIIQLLPSESVISQYNSNDTLLFSYNLESTPKINAYYRLRSFDEYSKSTAEVAIEKVFRGGRSNGAIIPSNVRTDFEFFKRVYNGSATYFNLNNGVVDTLGNKTNAAAEIFTDADEEGFVLHQVNFPELINLLNSSGDHLILFGASWCHNTQAIIGSIARKAKEYGYDRVYVYDTTLGNQLTFGTDNDINKVISGSSAFNSRNNVNVTTGNGNISYVYGELVKYLGNFITENNSKQNNSIAYYPNGDLTGTATSVAPWLSSGSDANAIRLQLPFFINYNKDKAEPVTKQWIHRNVGNNETYTEYMLELAWILRTPNALTAQGAIDGISKVDYASEAVAALDRVLKPDNYGVVLSETGQYNFPSVKVGYNNQTAHDFSVINAGGPTGKLTISLSGTGSNAFTLSTTEIKNISQNSQSTFSIIPNSGLKAGTYKATVTVTGNNNISAIFSVSFTVKKNK